MPSDFNSKMRSDPATPETSASDQKKVSESPESEAISEASGASGEPVASGGSVEGVAPGGSTFSDSSSSQVLNGGVPAGANSGLVQKSDGTPNVGGGDASVTRTLSPEEQDEKNLPFAMLSEVKIDGDMLDLGVIFDEYELIRFIGGGGMGNVWLAQDSNLNRLVALKVLHSDKSANREVIQRFYSEAQVSAMLNHPNISQIYAFRDHRDTHRMFLTMEYIEGENLRDRVKNSGVLKVSETVWIAIQITHALIHMAKFNVVHRDIKPSNILLTEKGEAKLIDFGLARIIAAPAESEKPVEGAGQADITASGVTLGTFDYISPEQARDPRMVDSRSDIYSLGCTLYYLLTGHPPFPQGNSLQKLLQHQSDNPMDVRLARVDVPESLNEILNKTMKKKPEERYATPEELLADLEMMAQELGLTFRGPTVDLQLEEAPEVKSETPGFLKRYVLPHLFWLVPLIVFLFAIWFLQRTWTPAPSELELPPAPVEEI